MDETQTKLMSIALTPRQIALLEILVGTDKSVPMNALEDLCKQKGFEVSRVTLFRDLTRMEELGLVSALGDTRARVYRAASSSSPYIAWEMSQNPALRKPVAYDFALLANYVPNQTFMLTGEQREHLAKVGDIEPVNPVEHDSHYAQAIKGLLVDLSHSSSQLEGVNISWLATKALIEFGEEPNHLKPEDLQIVLNHREAIEYLLDERFQLNKRDLCDLNALLLKGLLAEKDAIGRLRTRIVTFSGTSQYTPIREPSVLAEQFHLFCEKGQQIANPYEKAFYCMTFLPYLQSFQDGNKRTSRLAMNASLLNERQAPFCFSDIPKMDYLLGLMSFYERGHHQILAESFVAAYEKSAIKYGHQLSVLRDHEQVEMLYPKL